MAVREALKLLQSESASIGLHLNLPKCELWWPSRSTNLDVFPPDIRRIDGDGIELLGSGIGTPSFVSSIAESRVTQAATLHDVIPSLDDPQSELALLKSCAGVCKVTHVLRTSPPVDISSATARFDASLRRCLERVAEASIDDTSWS